MAPVSWVALACLAGIGLVESIEEPFPATTLESFGSEQMIVARLPQRSFDFPVLQAHVDLPDGWSYLSTTSPAYATNPTFVNESALSIVTLTSPHGLSESAVAVEAKPDQFDGCTIDWFRHRDPTKSLSITVNGIKIPVAWPEYQPRHVGLLQRENVVVQLTVFSPNAGRDEAIRKLCLGVEPISSD